MKTKKLLSSVAIVVDAGPGKEDRIATGSYVALREQEHRQSVPAAGGADSYLPSFLKDK